MFAIFKLCLGTIARVFCDRRRLLLANLALRQQLALFKRRNARPRLNALDKLFWLAAQRIWSGWKNSPIAVTPETVVGWHRAGFRFYWKVISRVRKSVGRTGVSKQVRDLILRMAAENPTWGAPRIYRELLLLGFDVSERTISRWMRKAPRDPEPGRRWLAFASL